MNKQEFIDMIDRFSDDTEFSYPCFWTRESLHFDGHDLSDLEWERFCNWWERKYDASYDYEDAIDYAKGA